MFPRTFILFSMHFQEIFDLITDWEPVFQQFIGCQKAIFASPCIDLDKPTVVFVGAPNVGKSSLVRSISTGRPEERRFERVFSEK